MPVVLLALSCATAQAATRAEPAPPLLLKPAIPAQLAELEAKADALQITSARVSISTSVRLGRPSKLARELARLLDFEVSGVETSLPPASALTIKLLGAHVRLRFAAGHVYLFVWALARHDGGRPWVRLGRGALGRLFGGLARKQAEKEVSGAVRYAELFTLLNGGAGIRALAPTTLYGQAVTGFEAEVEAATGGEGGLEAFSAARHATPATKAKRPRPRLSVYFAADGAVVRQQLELGKARTGFTITADTPAIDFPYAIPVPPASHVIGEAELRRHSRSRSKSKQ